MERTPCDFRPVSARRHVRISLSIATLAWLWGCTGDRPIPRAEFNELVVSGCRLPSIGSVGKVIPLETHPHALLGSVTKANIDARSGDILVADTESTKAVYRFRQDGRFVVAYRPPLGAFDESRMLMDFAILSDSSVVIASDNQLFHYAADGHLTATRHVQYRPYNLVSLQSSLYILAAAPHDNYAVHSYDEHLRPTGSFHRGDSRQTRYLFAPWNALTASNDHLFVSEFYEPRVTEYLPDGKPVAAYTFGPPDPTMQTIWAKSTLTDPDRAMIRLTARRFGMIYGYSGACSCMTSS